MKKVVLFVNKKQNYCVILCKCWLVADTLSIGKVSVSSFLMHNE